MINRLTFPPSNMYKRSLSLLQQSIENAAVTSLTQNKVWTANSSTAKDSKGFRLHNVSNPYNRQHLIYPDDLTNWDNIHNLKPSRSLANFIPEGVRLVGADPFELIKKEELNMLNEEMLGLIESDHPVLAKVARYFFEKQGESAGKKVRPVMVMLMSHALNSNSDKSSKEILDSQRRLSEITEMIHTASLFHDDVIDNSDSRRGVPTVNKIFGNKVGVVGVFGTCPAQTSAQSNPIHSKHSPPHLLAARNPGRRFFAQPSLDFPCSSS